MKRVALYLFGWGAAIFAVYLVLGLLGVVGAFWQAELDEAKRPALQKSIANDPERALADYERFYAECNSVLAVSEQITAREASLKAIQKTLADLDGIAAVQSQQTIAQMQGQIAGLQARQAEIANAYNARATQDGDIGRGQFLAAELPPQIHPPYSSVSCGS